MIDSKFELFMLERNTWNYLTVFKYWIIDITQ